MKRTLISLTAFALAAGLPLATPTASPLWADQPAEATEQDPTGNKRVSDDTEFVEINGETYTVGEFKILAAVRPMPGGFSNPANLVPRLRGERLEEYARHVGSFELLAQDAQEAGIELSDQNQESADDLAMRQANTMLYEQVVTDKLEDFSDEEIREKYEKWKDDMFAVKEELRMRHIFVSTYKEYEVQPGDTLESIAEEMSGDGEMADRIMSIKTKRPRIEGVETEEGKLEPRALVEGERLMVPMTEGESVEAAKKKIMDAYEELENGRQFAEVAKEYSENERPGNLWVIRPEEQDRPIMEELKETFMSLDNLSYSEPIRTKHGFQIVYRENYTPKGTLAYAEAKPRVRERLRREQTQELISGFFEQQIANEEIVSLHMENIKKGEGEAAAEDVLLTVDGQDFDRQSIATQLRMETSAPMGPVEDFKESAIQVPSVQRAIVNSYIENSGLMEKPSVQLVRETARETALANQFIEQKIEEEMGSISDEEAREYYEENIGRFTEKEGYSLYAVVDPLDEGETSAQLEEQIRGIQSLADFKLLASQINPTDNDKRFRSDNGMMGFVNAERIDEETLEVLRETESPGMTPVITREDEAIVYWIETAREETVKPFDEVKEQIKGQMKNRKKSELRQEILDEYEQKVEYAQLVEESEVEKVDEGK